MKLISTHCLLVLLLGLFGSAVPCAQAQQLDPAFVPTMLTNRLTTSDFVTRSMLVQPDGKIIVAGIYDYLDGKITSSVRRLNADGTPDAAFLTQTGTGPDVIYAGDLALQADGKILVGGEYAYYNGIHTAGLTRLNPDGSVDRSFNVGGTGFYAGIGTADITSVAVMPNGKILVGGELTTYNDVPVGQLVCLNPDGSLDTSFEFGANTITFPTNVTRISTILVQPDSKIIIGGAFTKVAGTTAGRLARLNANGTLDNTFTVGSGFNNEIRALALQPDNSLLVGGAFTQLGGQPSPSVVRLTPTGALDNSFQGGTISASGVVYQLRLRADGSVLVGGRFTSYNGVARGGVAHVSSAGVLDAAFAAGAGIGTVTGSGAVYGTADLSADQVLVGGAFLSYDGVSRTGLARLSSAGALDATYNPVYAKKGTVGEVIPLPNRQLIVSVGCDELNGQPVTKQYLLLNEDGSYNSEIPVSKVGGSYMQADGRSYVFTQDNATLRTLYRLLLNGAVDPSFTPVALIMPAGQSNVTMKLAPDGRVLVTGNITRANGQARTGMARFSATGVLDAAFAPATPWNGINQTMTAVEAVQSDGKILVSWNNYVDNTSHLVRFNDDGSPDNTFSVGGAGGAYTRFTTTLLPTGKLLVAGNFTSFNGQAAPRGFLRLNSNGTPDPTFVAAVGGPPTLLPNGQILVVERALSNNTSQIHRLHADGSRDATFRTISSPGGYFSETGVWGTVLQPWDGKLLAFGGFGLIDGQQRGGLARFTEVVLKNQPGQLTAPVLSLFPNPAHGSVRLKVEPAASSRPVQLLDYLGKQVGAFQVPAQASSIPLNVQGLPAGLYIVRCQDSVQKLVIE
ncbi:T9SS type A sorting domain-containing protein [Hymenobacter cellulosilyticus]|uniref:T9SS type A sorting domain-containing protein n=1 Tax=Hymenobacter cellulosilyticus TaxID=2932248 RepID=A0A8T9QIC3_9BACT|nr:T9SS type A sorting domain-containing protein [Hymenobacter cellulosilyticus]UOQ74543.1 T9SS type A sorting domain-containing protein [Hymenobacter cellulosilyticus]